MNYSAPVEGETADLYPLKGKVATISGCHRFLAMSLRLVSLELSSLGGLDAIGDDFLAGCRSLREVDLQGLEAVRRIGSGFLRDCDQLEQLDVTPLVSVEEVGGAFLMNTKKLADLDLRPMHCVKWNLEQWLEGTPNLNILRIGLTGTSTTELKKALERQAAAKKRKEPCTVGRKDTTKPLKVKVDGYETPADVVAAADWVKLFVALECTEDVDPAKASKWVRSVEKTQDNFERDRWSIVAAAKTTKQEQSARDEIEADAGVCFDVLQLDKDESRRRLQLIGEQRGEAADISVKNLVELEASIRLRTIVAESSLFGELSTVECETRLRAALLNEERVGIDCLLVLEVEGHEAIYRSLAASLEIVEFENAMLDEDESKTRLVISMSAVSDAYLIALSTAAEVESTSRLDLVLHETISMMLISCEAEEARDWWLILSDERIASDVAAAVSLESAQVLWRMVLARDESSAFELLRANAAREQGFVAEWLAHDAMLHAEEQAEQQMFDVLHGRLRVTSSSIMDESSSWHDFISLRLEDLKGVRHAERQRLYRGYFSELLELSKLVVADEFREPFRSAVVEALP